MRLSLFAVVALLVLSFVSCGEKKPKNLIPASKMEDVLYDYHLLSAMRTTLGLDSAKAAATLEELYKKYGITQADFDTSMVYYLRHTDQMYDIYQRLSERIENEATAQGAEGGGIDFSAGDTTNVWRGATARIFSSNAPYNLMQFKLPVDTAYKAGDKMVLSFQTDFLYESGMRSGLAMLAVTLTNDSVVTRTITMSNSGRQQLEITDTKRDGIKAVQGFFLQKESNNAADKNSTAVRMMLVSNIKLIRMHIPEEPKKDDVETTDTLNAEKKDSLGVTPLNANAEEVVMPQNEPVVPSSSPNAPDKKTVTPAPAGVVRKVVQPTVNK